MNSSIEKLQYIKEHLTLWRDLSAYFFGGCACLLYLKALLFNQSIRSLLFWYELILSDLLLMYINKFQGQQDKVTFEKLSQEMDLCSFKIILTQTKLFIMEKNR